MLFRTLQILVLTLMALGAVAATTTVVDMPWDRTVVVNAASSRAELVDRPALDFTLPDLEGRPVQLSQLRGELVFVNFWATWCAPCREEIPSMIELAASMQGRPFRMVAISQDEDRAALDAFVAEFGLDETQILVLHDPEGEVARAWGTELLPESYLVDREGTVAFRFQNSRDWTAPEVGSILERMLVNRWRVRPALHAGMGASAPQAR
jgi:cytochrome c biogenesis protein CcmG/thiol:disulfide interchange protein DsbE